MLAKLPKPTNLPRLKNPFFIVVVLCALAAGSLVTVSPILAIAVLIGFIFTCCWLWMLVKRPFWILLILLTYLCFEAVLIRYIAISGQIIIVMQFFSEAVVYSTFAFVMLKRIVLTKRIRKTPLDSPILFILCVMGLSILINPTPILASLINVRTTLRFIFLYYTIINLDITSDQIKILLKLILVIGFVQIAGGLLQILSRGALNPYLLPRPADLIFAGYSQQFRLLTKGREVGSIFGTLGDTVYFGLFMLILLAIYLSQMRRLKLSQLLIAILILGTIGYSFARAVTFAALLLVILYFIVRWGMKRSIFLLLILLPMFIAGMLVAYMLISSNNNEYYNPVRHEQSIFQNLTGVFSQNYVEVAKKQRLGALLGITPTVLANRPLLGYGPDTQTTIDQLNASEPNYLLETLPRAGFEDVYWVSILAYYGLIGVFAFIFLFYRLGLTAYKIYKNGRDHLTRTVALTVFLLAAITPFLLFFSQVLEFRIFSAFFWVMAALMYVQYRQEISNREPALKG